MFMVEKKLFLVLYVIGCVRKLIIDIIFDLLNICWLIGDKIFSLFRLYGWIFGELIDVLNI